MRLMQVMAPIFPGKPGALTPPPVGTEVIGHPDKRAVVFDQGANPAINSVGRNRLGEKFRHTRVARGADMAQCRVGSANDEGNEGIRAFNILAHLGQKRHAVQAFGPITKDDIDGEITEHFPSNIRFRRTLHRWNSELAENIGQKLANQQVLLKHQNAQTPQVIRLHFITYIFWSGVLHRYFNPVWALYIAKSPKLRLKRTVA